MLLSPAQVSDYHRDGFLVLADFVDRRACQELRTRAEELVAAFEPGPRRSIFTTNEQERTSDREFFESANGSWCFFEADAFDTQGRLRQPKALSINKIGHAMHDLDPVFEAFSYTPELAAVAADVGMTAPVALQSMYIFKQPHIGGEVGCHQDATFLYTEPVSVTGFWFALEDATVHNGCLWAAPGGHRTGLRQLFRRCGPTDDDGSEFVTLDPAPLPRPAEVVPLEVAAGTLVVLHGLLPHWSDVNRSSQSRHAYSLHCIEQNAPYPEWNWLQRSASLPLRRLDRTDRTAA